MSSKFEKMTVPELRELCKSKKIKGYSGKTKSELVKLCGSKAKSKSPKKSAEKKKSKSPKKKSKSPKKKSPAKKSKSPKKKSPAKKAKSKSPKKSAEKKKAKSKSPKKKSPAKKSKSPKKKSPAKKSKSPKKKSPAKKSKSPKKKSPAKKSKSPKKKSPKKKSPKKKSPAKKKSAEKKKAKSKSPKKKSPAKKSKSPKKKSPKSKECKGKTKEELKECSVLQLRSRAKVKGIKLSEKGKQLTKDELVKKILYAIKNNVKDVKVKTPKKKSEKSKSGKSDGKSKSSDKPLNYTQCMKLKKDEIQKLLEKQNKSTKGVKKELCLRYLNLEEEELDPKKKTFIHSIDLKNSFVTDDKYILIYKNKDVFRDITRNMKTKNVYIVDKKSDIRKALEEITEQIARLEDIGEKITEAISNNKIDEIIKNPNDKSIIRKIIDTCLNKNSFMYVENEEVGSTKDNEIKVSKQRVLRKRISFSTVVCILNTIAKGDTVIPESYYYYIPTLMEAIQSLIITYGRKKYDSSWKVEKRNKDENKRNLTWQDLYIDHPKKISELIKIDEYYVIDYDSVHVVPSKDKNGRDVYPSNTKVGMYIEIKNKEQKKQFESLVNEFQTQTDFGDYNLINKLTDEDIESGITSLVKLFGDIDIPDKFDKKKLLIFVNNIFRKKHGRLPEYVYSKYQEGIQKMDYIEDKMKQIYKKLKGSVITGNYKDYDKMNKLTDSELKQGVKNYMKTHSNINLTRTRREIKGKVSTVPRKYDPQDIIPVMTSIFKEVHNRMPEYVYNDRYEPETDKINKQLKKIYDLVDNL